MQILKKFKIDIAQRKIWRFFEIVETRERIFLWLSEINLVTVWKIEQY